MHIKFPRIFKSAGDDKYFYIIRYLYYIPHLFTMLDTEFLGYFVGNGPMLVAQDRNDSDVLGDFVSATLLASWRVNPPVAVTHRQQREHGREF